MDPGRLASDVNNICILLAFFTAVVFILAVSTFWPWWRTHLGRSVMLLAGALTLFILSSAVSRLTAGSWNQAAYDWLNSVALIIAGPSIAYCGASLWRIQRSPTSQEQADADAMLRQQEHGH